MNEEKQKLKKRIEHWAHHNDEHSLRFEEAAKNAEALELETVALALRAAAVSGKSVSKELRKAEENII